MTFQSQTPLKYHIIGRNRIFQSIWFSFITAYISICEARSQLAMASLKSLLWMPLQSSIEPVKLRRVPVWCAWCGLCGLWMFIARPTFGCEVSLCFVHVGRAPDFMENACQVFKSESCKYLLMSQTPWFASLNELQSCKCNWCALLCHTVWYRCHVLP